MDCCDTCREKAVSLSFLAVDVSMWFTTFVSPDYSIVCRAGQ